MWRAFAAARGVEGARYDVWAFGGDPDGLARLALDGGKTATSSAHPLYALGDDPLPEAGEYSVILDGRGEAVCVIRTERAYWRRVHEAFFTEAPAQAGLRFTPDMPVVCEEFRRVWPE